MIGFVVLRDAIFTTAGYCLAVHEAVPGGLKGRNFSFVVTNAEGKTTCVEPVVSDAGADAGEIFIHLKPYRGLRKHAPELVYRMCCHLRGAHAGVKADQRLLGDCARMIIFTELESADTKARAQLLESLFGSDRALDWFKRPETLVDLAKLDTGNMVAEAFA